MAKLDLTISLLPSNFTLDMIEPWMIHVLALNANMPLSKVAFTQTENTPRNLHMFQVLTLDARQWFDELEGDIGPGVVPSLIRLGTSTRRCRRR